MSKKDSKIKRLKGAECTDTLSGRLKPGALDQYYIDAYIDNPKLSQIKVLQIAMKTAEVEGMATRQQAYAVHDRNRERINAEMVKVASDLKNLSISVIKDLMINSESDSVKLSAAQTGTKDIFPNVTIKKEVTLDEIDDNIAAIQREVDAIEGKTH